MRVCRLTCPRGVRGVLEADVTVAGNTSPHATAAEIKKHSATKMLKRRIRSLLVSDYVHTAMIDDKVLSPHGRFDISNRATRQAAVDL
jgi:hypothetical protein